MKITPLNKEERRHTYLIEGVDAGYLNTLRRAMEAQVRTLAIEHVEFRKNSSALYDEVIAHRLGLLALTGDASIASEENPVVLTLNIDAVEQPTTIYAEQLHSSDSTVKPVHPATPIVGLIAGQSLMLEAKAVPGCGREHAKWSPGLVFYRRIPTFTITKDAEAVKKEYAADYEVKGKQLVLKDLAAAIKRPGLLDFDDERIESTPGESYLLVVESWGQLTPTQIVEQGVAMFNEDIKTFAGLVNNEVKA